MCRILRGIKYARFDALSIGSRPAGHPMVASPVEPSCSWYSIIGFLRPEDTCFRSALALLPHIVHTTAFAPNEVLVCRSYRLLGRRGLDSLFIRSKIAVPFTWRPGVHLHRGFDVPGRLLRHVTISSLACAATILAGCSAGGSSSDAHSGDTVAAAGNRIASDSFANAAAPGAVIAASPVKPGPHLGDPDRDFLHHMLDHYEAVLLIVHDDMMKPEGHAIHGSGADPLEHDAALDAEKQQMLMLLNKMYGEQYSPRPVSAKPVASAAGKAKPDPPLATHFRAGVALVDRSLSALERREVRGLAIKMRATQLARLKAMGEGAEAEH